MNKLKDIRGMTEEEKLQWYQSLSEEEKEEIRTYIHTIYDNVFLPFLQAVGVWYEECFQPLIEHWQEILHGEE